MLSDAWFHAVQAAFDAAASPAPGRLVLDQHFSDRPDDGYRIVLGESSTITPLRDLPDDGYRIVLGESSSITPLRDLPVDGPAPDASFTQSLESAQAIARGEADAHQAFLLGDIDFTGDISTLITHRPSLDWLAEVMVRV